MLLTRPALPQMCKNNNGNTTDGLSDDVPDKLANLNEYCHLQDQEQGNLRHKHRQTPVDNHFDRESPTSPSPELHKYISIINPNYPGFQHLAHTLHYSLPICSDSETEYSTDSCQSTSDSCQSGDNIENHTDQQNIETPTDTYRRYSTVSQNSMNFVSGEQERYLNYENITRCNENQFHNDRSNRKNVELYNKFITIPRDDNFGQLEDTDQIPENECQSNSESWPNTVVHMSEDTEPCSDINGQTIDSCQSDCSSCCDSNCCSGCQSPCNGCQICESENSSVCEQQQEYGLLHNDGDCGKCSSEVNQDKNFANNNNVYSAKEDDSEHIPDNDRANMRQSNVSVVGDLSSEIENAIDEKLSKFSLSQKNQRTESISAAEHSDRPLNNKMADAFLSNARDTIPMQTTEKYCLGSEKESIPPGTMNQSSKLDKTQINSQVKRSRQLRNAAKIQQQKQQSEQESLDGFDVYNIETAMPVIDLDAIEAHLKAAKDEEMRRRTDREEIRRRLAMGPEPENFSKAPRKKSLQSRLQSGMNLQICFMNDVSDNEGLTSEINVQENEKPALMSETIGLSENTIVPPNHFKSIDEPNTDANERSGLLTIQMPKTEEDFFACQARLQVEARLALAQAKQMAHMQMELERQKQVSSPITDVIRSALTTVGCASPEHHRRLSRRLLTSMTIAQLQVVVCRLHTQVEIFNEQLVGLLMNRDELHMSQDSMLVDIEDLTRYL
ncbi:schwannomin-interacting protein 1 homolog isoform X2 [Ctenocephalides felis]|nr:schwannomin-interacting protein 1 homolog isoform X2 [Ctenocephalides felis]